MWLGPRKIAIFVAVISECLIHTEAKYCAFEIHGEPKYYVCPRTEYCCNFGCCVSPGFQIYHLWYYWLLVIIMFLVCSGGGWWYRYWLQGRYRPSASTVPARTSSSRAQNALRGPTCRAQQARVTYNPARNTVLLHRMWKGPQRNATPPAYNGAAASSAQFQNTNVVLNDNNCPYYELYGPPPSYETVIAQTRGKMMSPTPLEHPRSIAQTSPGIQNQNLSHCYTHNNYSSLPTRIHIDQDMTERRNSCGSNLGEPADNYMQNLGYKNFVQKCDNQQVLRLGSHPPLDNFCRESTASGTRPTVTQNVFKKLPESRHDGAGVLLEDVKSISDTFNTVNDLAERNNPSVSSAGGQFTQGVHTSQAVRETEEQTLNDLELAIMETEQPSDENHIRLDPPVSRVSKMFIYSKADPRTDGFGEKYSRSDGTSSKERCGGSGDRYCDVHKYKEIGANDNPSSSSTGCAAAPVAADKKSNYYSDCEECLAQNEGSISKLNPSNNVISPSLNPNVQINSSITPINIIENYQHYPPTSPAQRSTTSTNIESENKLGRSKSLD